jgi:hypothetical protein
MAPTTTTNVRIINSGPKNMPYHPPFHHIMPGPYPYLSDPVCAHAQAGVKTGAAIDAAANKLESLVMCILHG